MAVEVLGIIIGTFTVLGIIEVRVKGLTKNYLEELKPNHGSSIKDKIDKLEERQSELVKRIDDIYSHLLGK